MYFQILAYNFSLINVGHQLYIKNEVTFAPKPCVPFEPLQAVLAVPWSRHLHAAATLPAAQAVLWSRHLHDAAETLPAVQAVLESRRRLASTSKRLICQ